MIVNIWRSLGRHRILTIALCLLGAAGAYALATLLPVRYQSTSRLVVSPSSAIEEANDRIQAGQVLNQPAITANLSELVLSERVLEAARAAAGLRVAQVEDVTITAAVTPDANVVTISVIDADEAVPTALIEPITTEGAALFEQLYEVYRADVIDLEPDVEALPPPHPLVAAIVGLLAGLLAAAGLGLFLDELRGQAEAPATADLPPAPPVARPDGETDELAAARLRDAGKARTSDGSAEGPDGEDGTDEPATSTVMPLPRRAGSSRSN